MSELIGKEIKVLDKGFVRVVDLMGDDSSIVQAARISYGAGTKTKSSDRQLIRYMMSHGHTSPFEMCEIKLHVKVPMDTWRQMVRHRTASINEYSTRYSQAIDEMQETKPNAWRQQSKTNKQGSGEGIDPFICDLLSIRERKFHEDARDMYKARLTFGVAREQARKDLPLSTYTEAYWKIDLHNLLHFLSKRLPSDAQLEIREYAQAIASIVKEWVPFAWEAFEDYRLNAITLSAGEIEAIRQYHADPGKRMIAIHGSHREMAEFNAKLKRLGIEIGKATEGKP